MKCDYIFKVSHWLFNGERAEAKGEQYGKKKTS